MEANLAVVTIAFITPVNQTTQRTNNRTKVNGENDINIKYVRNIRQNTESNEDDRYRHSVQKCENFL